MRALAHTSVLLLVSVFACPTARAQTALYTFDGDSPNDWFGFAASGAGDVNGDGFDDLIAGAHYDDNTGLSSGSARVLSGVDGTVLYALDGDSQGDWFGFSVSGAGDVNGDGYADLIVGARLDDNNGTDSGMARVFSGVDGSTLYTFDGDAAGDLFGVSVSGAGDVNGDGFDDVIVGAYRADSNGFDSGLARVFSGVDGSVLYTFDGDSAFDWFGFSVSGAGDVDANGYADLIVGAYRDDNNGTDSGSARVFSGQDGSVLYDFDGGAAWDRFGYSVSGAGDVNGDGFDELIVGAQSAGVSAGMARVFSGVDGSILYTFNGDSTGDQFGFSVSDAGDMNRDGFDDLIVGALRDDNNGWDSGMARVFSGVDGSVLHSFDGDSPQDLFGVSVSGAGDVDGDGFVDLIVGAWGDDNNGIDSGSARVVSGRDVIGSNYCVPAVPNSTGSPGVIIASGFDVAPDNDVVLTAAQLPPGQVGYFLASQAPGFSNPAGSQGFLCLGGNVGRYSGTVIQGPKGSIRIDLTSIPVTPSQPVLPGDTWKFQCWYKDANPGPTSNFTDAVSITFL